MTKKANNRLTTKPAPLAKTPTGIDGLDEITDGGLPTGRPTLVCGSAGCGKTLMAVQFLIKGITDYNEPGVFMTFEEPLEDLTKNVASLGYDLKKLIANKKLRVDHVKVERSEIEESGEYNLEGLFIRLEHAINSIGAKRVVLDTIESLFGGLDNAVILRAEIRRLFNWLKTKGVTTIITGERGDSSLTRQGLEEYVSDCVILLDFRVIDQISTRRLRIVKYRGSTHGTNEYPFLIDESGISVLPITSLRLEHKVSNKIVSTGIEGLDKLFKKGGYYQGSSILISGTAGTAKTTLACYFTQETCKHNSKVLYFAFEESPNQLIRNMESVGIDLRTYIDKGLLQIHSSRPTLHGLEMHLLSLHKLIRQFKPQCVVIDPISNMISIGTISEVRAMLVRLIDLLKINNITALFTSLTQQNVSNTNELTEESVSSLVDTWITVRDVEGVGERNRGLYILKSRGMAHSNQVREFILTDKGLQFLDFETGPEGILLGSARKKYQLDSFADTAKRKKELEKRDREIIRKKKILEANILAMRTEYESVEEELHKLELEERVLNFQSKKPVSTRPAKAVKRKKS
ncbi:MAG: KaiC-like protein [Bacteroidetes bacterium]|jgi:circadian clock protein KaiC|nr:KaiC-like protein [Bacteroidota bacterium]